MPSHVMDIVHDKTGMHSDTLLCNWPVIAPLAARVQGGMSMFRSSTVKKVALAALAALACSAAYSQVYVGGAFGPSRHNVDCTNALACDADDVGGKVYMGFPLNPIVAAEVGYINFGSSKSSGFVQGLGNAEATTDVAGVYGALALRGYFAPGFNGVLRVGAASVTLDGRTDYLSGSSVQGSNSDMSLFVGGGLEFALNRNARLTVSYDYTQAPDGTFDKMPVGLFGVGVQVGF
jgi:OmpA-OmpF porin, OOP family